MTNSLVGVCQGRIFFAFGSRRISIWMRKTVIVSVYLKVQWALLFPINFAWSRLASSSRANSALFIHLFFLYFSFSAKTISCLSLYTAAALAHYYGSPYINAQTFLSSSICRALASIHTLLNPPKLAPNLRVCWRHPRKVSLRGARPSGHALTVFLIRTQATFAFCFRDFLRNVWHNLFFIFASHDQVLLPYFRSWSWGLSTLPRPKKFLATLWARSILIAPLCPSSSSVPSASRCFLLIVSLSMLRKKDIVTLVYYQNISLSNYCLRLNG